MISTLSPICLGKVWTSLERKLTHSVCNLKSILSVTGLPIRVIVVSTRPGRMGNKRFSLAAWSTVSMWLIRVVNTPNMERTRARVAGPNASVSKSWMRRGNRTGATVYT